MLSFHKRINALGFTNRKICKVLIVSIIAVFAEVIGVSIFLPIFQFIRLEGNTEVLVNEYPLWQYFLNLFNLFNIPITLLTLLLFALTIFIARQVFTYLKIYITQSTEYQVTKNLKDKIFSRYLSADIDYYSDMPIGGFANIIAVEIPTATQGVRSAFTMVVQLILVISYFVLLLFLSFEMTVASVMILFLSLLVPKGWIAKSKEVGKTLTESNNQSTIFLVSRLKSPKLVRLSGTESLEKNQFSDLTEQQKDNSITNINLVAKTDSVIEPIAIGFSLCFLYFAVVHLDMEIESIGLYLLVIIRLLPSFKHIVLQWQRTKQKMASIEIIEKRLAEMDQCAEKNQGNQYIGGLSKGIVFNQVSFKYPSSNKYALDDISLNIRAREITAIIGPSGSGKSTLIDLIPRLRTPNRGEIYFDDINVNKFSLESVRKLIAYSPQSPQIFDGTIRKHIEYGREVLSDEQIIKVAKLAGIHDFVSKLDDGYDTEVGDDGVKLSGGQKQRLDLARALARDSDILILDEPTSSLDVELENQFFSDLNKINQQTKLTIIVISHSLRSIEHINRIIVLNNGRIEASGNHNELLENSFWYRNAWKK